MNGLMTKECFDAHSLVTLRFSAILFFLHSHFLPRFALRSFTFQWWDGTLVPSFRVASNFFFFLSIFYYIIFVRKHKHFFMMCCGLFFCHLLFTWLVTIVIVCRAHMKQISSRHSEFACARYKRTKEWITPENWAFIYCVLFTLDNRSDTPTATGREEDVVD